MTRMPSSRLASPTAGRRRPPEVNRTDITDFTKEKEKRSKKERENVLRRRCSKPGRGGLVRPLKPGTLLTQVGPVYSPMWVPFTRRLPPGRWLMGDTFSGPLLALNFWTIRGIASSRSMGCFFISREALADLHAELIDGHYDHHSNQYHGAHTRVVERTPI